MKLIRRAYFKYRYRRERRLGNALNDTILRIYYCMLNGAPEPEGGILQDLVNGMHAHYDRAEAWKSRLEAL